MKSPFVAAFAALAVGASAAVVTVAQDKDKPVPTRLGFLDLGKAYDMYRKRKDVSESLNAKKKDVLASLKKRASEIDEKSGNLNTLNPGTPQYANLERDIAYAKFSLDFDQKSYRNELQDEERKQLAAIYKEISQEAEAYGAEHGLAAVLLYLPPDFDVGSNLELFSFTRAVLCRDPQLDVTKEVVDRLNAFLPPPAAAPHPAPAQGDDPKDPKKPK
jgi:Skp family chaperone for outer membrane proteins